MKTEQTTSADEDLAMRSKAPEQESSRVNGQAPTFRIKHGKSHSVKSEQFLEQAQSYEEDHVM